MYPNLTSALLTTQTAESVVADLTIAETILQFFFAILTQTTI